jgi:hypothetical protein
MGMKRLVGGSGVNKEIQTWMCSVTLRSLSSDMDCFGWRFDMDMRFSLINWCGWVVYCTLYPDEMDGRRYQRTALTDGVGLYRKGARGDGKRGGKCVQYRKDLGIIKRERLRRVEVKAGVSKSRTKEARFSGSRFDQSLI